MMRVRSKVHLLPALCWPPSRLGMLLGGVVMCGVFAAVSVAQEPGGTQPAPAAWRFERADGTAVVGALQSLDPAGIVLASPDGNVTLALEAVRALEPVEKPAATAMDARVWLTDGSFLAGGSIVFEGREMSLEQDGTRLVMPQNAVAKVAWNLAGDDAAVGAAVPVWQATVPADVDSDLIVIRKSVDPEPVYQCVPCAILAIDAEHVTVALDDDRIPVKRERVAGLVWLRAESEVQLQGPVVDLVGGRLLTREVRYLADSGSLTMVTAWSPEVTVPVTAVRRIDLAAGRTVSLTTLLPEASSVEPAFASLSKVDELGVAFEPRILLSGDVAPSGLSGPMILAMPRTVLRWKLPAGVRQLRMTAAGERLQGGGADLVVVVDGQERMRRAIASDGSAGVEIDVDVSGGRSLEVHVDFPSGLAGQLVGLGRIQLIDPRLEK